MEFVNRTWSKHCAVRRQGEEELDGDTSVEMAHDPPGRVSDGDGLADCGAPGKGERNAGPDRRADTSKDCHRRARI